MHIHEITWFFFRSEKMRIFFFTHSKFNGSTLSCHFWQVDSKTGCDRVSARENNFAQKKIPFAAQYFIFSWNSTWAKQRQWTYNGVHKHPIEWLSTADVAVLVFHSPMCTYAVPRSRREETGINLKVLMFRIETSKRHWKTDFFCFVLKLINRKLCVCARKTVSLWALKNWVCDYKSQNLLMRSILRNECEKNFI